MTDTNSKGVTHEVAISYSTLEIIYVSCNMKTVFLAYWIALFDSSIRHLSPTNIALSFETEVKEPIGTSHNMIYVTLRPGQPFLPPRPHPKIPYLAFES